LAFLSAAHAHCDLLIRLLPIKGALRIEPLKITLITEASDVVGRLFDNTGFGAILRLAALSEVENLWRKIGSQPDATEYWAAVHALFVARMEGAGGLRELWQEYQTAVQSNLL
jgi:hypothetical protein